MKLNYPEAVVRYGAIVNNQWKNEPQWMMIYKTPMWFSQQVINSATGNPCDRIYLNKDLAPILTKALQLVHERNLCSELKTFDGCYNIRDIRGKGGTLSAHSYGIAIDLKSYKRDYWKWSSKEDGKKRICEYPKELIEAFEKNNFVWGGRWGHFDILHFEYRPEIILKAKYFANCDS